MTSTEKEIVKEEQSPDTILAPEGFEYASFGIKRHLIRKVKEEKNTEMSLCNFRPFLITKGVLAKPITIWEEISCETYEWLICKKCLKNYNRQRRSTHSREKA